MLTRTATFNTIQTAATCEYLRDGTLLCGTYHLIPADGSTGQEAAKRVGDLLVLGAGGQTISMKKDGFMLPGVLDIKPNPVAASAAVMLSDGSVRMYKTPDVDGRLEEVQNISTVNGLCLAGAWSTTDLAVSDSCGGVSIIKPTEAGYCVADSGLSALHELEVWAVCWDIGDSSIVYSGADDALLKMSDLRSGKSVTVRGHEAGVTSILSGSGLDYDILTGSYDEAIRHWDKRSLKAPISSLNLAGGVWKIKINETDHSVLGCACMQGGGRIVRFSRTDGFNKLEDFMLDRQLVYGFDWRPSEHTFEFAACSFYDHVIDLFSFELGES